MAGQKLSTLTEGLYLEATMSNLRYKISQEQRATDRLQARKVEELCNMDWSDFLSEIEKEEHDARTHMVHNGRLFNPDVSDS